MPELDQRIAALRERIRTACDRANKPVNAVELLPVSKRHPLEAIRAALACGFHAFGENYVQEGAAKAQALPEARFLLLGPLQKNKVKPALQNFHEVLSVDRLELVQRMGRISEELGLTRPVWIQVDLWGEATKMGGCPAPLLDALIRELGQWRTLPLRGFMAIPPPELPEAFNQMAVLRSTWTDRLGIPLRLSMGMSDDLEEAILAGADQVRVGTDFFGPRTRPVVPDSPEIPDPDNI